MKIKLSTVIQRHNLKITIKGEQDNLYHLNTLLSSYVNDYNESKRNETEKTEVINNPFYAVIKIKKDLKTVKTVNSQSSINNADTYKILLRERYHNENIFVYLHNKINLVFVEFRDSFFVLGGSIDLERNSFSYNLTREELLLVEKYNLKKIPYAHYKSMTSLWKD